MQSPKVGRRLPQRKVGDILLLKGKITEEQLEEVLEVQQAEGGNLGEILISLGYITFDDLAQALSGCLNVEYISLSEIEIDPEVVGIIGEENRSDALDNARTALEDYATGKAPEENLRRTLAVLIEEGEWAAAEARRYHEEVGIRPE